MRFPKSGTPETIKILTKYSPILRRIGCFFSFQRGSTFLCIDWICTLLMSLIPISGMGPKLTASTSSSSSAYQEENKIVPRKCWHGMKY